MIIHKIAETDGSTLIGMNGGQTESPDGKHIIYARKKTLAQKQGMELWVCGTDMKNHRHIYSCDCGNHNGPSATFIDNSTVVFRDMSDNTSCIVIMDINSLEVRYKIYGKEGHRAENGIYPFSVTEEYLDKNPGYPALNKTGIYTLNVNTGEIRHIISGNGILDMVREHGLTPTPATASVSHVQLNPSASAVMMRLGVKECPVFGALGCIDMADGKTHMIKDKPVHQLWYDDDTYMAARQFKIDGRIDMATSYIARFSKEGEETEVLGGIGNHIDGNKQRTLFAGDRCYPGYSPDIYIYEKGSKRPAAEIKMKDLQKVIWEYQVHPNPSFSQDGKRLYFNMPVSGTKTEACFVEVE